MRAESFGTNQILPFKEEPRGVDVMRRWSDGLLILLAGTLIAADQAPPPPEAGPNPTPPPVPVSPDVSVPPLITIPSSGYLLPDQPHHGPLILPSPAQNLAMLETGRVLSSDDPAVASAASVLTRLTAGYVEDAPRIAELTIRVVQRIRAANQAASPMEILVGATRWKRPDGTRGNIPRKFEEFARLYQKWRIEQGKDHAAALSLMQPSRPSNAPVP
jgi:hypothetical protein